MKNMTECARSAVMMLDGEISKYVNILQGVTQGCTLSPNVFKVYINDMISSSRSSKARSHDGGRYGVGVDVADDIVGISETPERLQKQIRESTRLHLRNGE